MDKRIEEMFGYVYKQIQDSKDGDVIDLEKFVYNPPKNAPEFLGLVDEVSTFWFQIVSEEYFLPGKEVKKTKKIKKTEVLDLF